RLGDVVDQFLNQDRLSYAGSAKQTDFSAFSVGRQEIDHFDARLKHLNLGALVHKLWCGSVNGPVFLRIDWTGVVHRLADDVQNPSQNAGPNWHADGGTRVSDLQSSN